MKIRLFQRIYGAEKDEDLYLGEEYFLIRFHKKVKEGDIKKKEQISKLFQNLKEGQKVKDLPDKL